jgi:HEAT repeat protein
MPPAAARESEMAIDWKELAKQVGDLNADDSERGSGTESGERALELLIGEENLRNAVDHFISLEPGAFTAEMVLKIIGSEIAMNRCFEIYKAEPNTDRACSAVFLLGSMADDRALSWVREFLEDRSQPIRLNGLRVLQNILFGPLDDAQIATAKELFAKAESDSDPTVRERAVQIRQHSVLRS